MKSNVGTIDRTIRILVGLGAIGATSIGAIGAWGWLGIIPLATGIFRFCPAYLPFGISSCATKNNG
ncbi:YgaP family membrane protein [Undibacterium sp. SXout11W]|uniref:YgaP family membrane protein n=1 Tax=Undibacterium sp. SXout11W TaxID=3413050 RepID=UPI003BF39F89